MLTLREFRSRKQPPLSSHVAGIQSRSFLVMLDVERGRQARAKKSGLRHMVVRTGGRFVVTDHGARSERITHKRPRLIGDASAASPTAKEA